MVFRVMSKWVWPFSDAHSWKNTCAVFNKAPHWVSSGSWLKRLVAEWETKICGIGLMDKEVVLPQMWGFSCVMTNTKPRAVSREIVGGYKPKPLLFTYLRRTGAW